MLTKDQIENKDYKNALELERESNFKEAYKIFLTLLNNINYDYGDIAFHCGWCLENSDKGRLGEIITYYEKAGDRASDFRCRYNAFFRKGWVYLQLKDFRKAMEAFKKVIDISDSFEDDIVQNAMYWYALCLESLGHYLEAIKWFRIVTDISPALNPESRSREIRCLINVGLYKDALKVCYTFFTHTPPLFNRERYFELKKIAEKEIRSLKLSF